MEALILAAGYATRLGDLTANRAKPLLPIGDKPMIDYIFGQLAALPEVTGVSVVTNAKFAPQFRDWAATHNGAGVPVSVIDDATSSDADKLGAVGDIRLVLRTKAIADDLLIVAGDNLFDFPLTSFIDFFRQNGTSVGLYDTGDLSIMNQYAVVQLDPDTARVTEFVEKPAQPTSTLAATAIYLWQRQHLPLVEQYAQAGGNMDAPGHFIAWLSRQVPIYGFRIPGRWLDIGNREQYTAAQALYAR